MSRWIALIAVAAGCSGGGGSSRPVPEPAAGAPRATSDPGVAPVVKRTLDKDQTVTSRSGATFTASGGWTVEERPEGIALVAPEGDLRLTHVEVAAAGRGEAIAAAWKRVQPAFALKVAQEVDLPARDGWDAVGQVVYVTPAAEQRLVVAVARRKGPTWYVSLLDGKAAAFDRRGAQMFTAIESLKVKGLEKESFAGRKANALDAARLAELDRFVEESRAALRVPGVAVAVVQDGKVVLAKGYGVRKQGGRARVGPRTLFLIGSVTKPLTSLMMARLIDEKRFTWDTPVTEVLPSFALGDAATTRSVQMRHTVCACTGMPRQDFEFIFEFGGVTAEDRLASMKGMKPTTGFGETFQYSNLMVSAGGFAAAHARAPGRKLAAAYADAMKSLVFAPLGMRSTTLDVARAARGEHAAPHPADLTGAPAAIAPAAEGWVGPVAPAGAVWSNAEDLARYVLLELGKGTLDGKRVVSEEQLLARRAPQVKITDEASYGLALGVTRESGIQVIGHDGATAGFRALVQILPEHGVGLVVLANSSEGGALLGAVNRRLVELLFDGKPEAKDNLAARIKLDAEERAEQLKMVGEADAAWFDPLAGRWFSPGLGPIELRRDRRGATLDAGEWKVTVGKKTDRDGTVKIITTGPPIVGLELEPRQKDGRQVLVLPAGQHEYVFERSKK
ncbi:MAG TPA: serine hydrolase domain-containing protein [Kofleriaceae bacterium]|nr:serine hydrolase domain-containing protein [Kofleriaceae bacterium]